MNQPNQPQPAPVWVDGDPYLEALASAIWRQCNTTEDTSLVHDDPRTIAAVAATVPRPDGTTGA